MCFSAVLSNLRQKTTVSAFHYNSLKSWKIDDIDLKKQFSLKIFTVFRYQSIKTTWLLSAFIDIEQKSRIYTSSNQNRVFSTA